MNNFKKYSFVFLVWFAVNSGISIEAAPPAQLSSENVDYMSVELRWEDNSSFGDIQILQRKKSSESEFRTIARFPHTADFFIDLGLASDTTYNYRIATRETTGVSSWSEHTTKTKVNPHTAVFNVKDFGATGNGTTNDTAAIRSAIKDAEVNGGTVYLPAGTYAVAPEPGEGDIFVLKNGNLFFKGDGPDKTIISCYVSGLRDPETNWDYNSRGTLIRGTAFLLPMDVEKWHSNFKFEDLRVTGNARPTGDTAWWTNEQKEQGWDISHKGIYLGLKNGNVYIKNTIWDNFRGEIIYSGDPWTKKLKLEDSKIYGSNSSAISTAADFEAVNIEVWDAANSCIESAYFHDFNGQISPQQNCVVINSRFKASSTMLNDTNANPVLKKPGAGKIGIAVFNAPNCYIIFDNCTLEKSDQWGFLMDVGQRNMTVIDTTFIDAGRNGSIYFETKDKKDYNLTGAVENFMVENCTFIANQGATIWGTHNYHPKNQKDILFKNNYVELRGGKSTVHVDAHQWDGLRENFVFDGNTIVENGGKLIRFTQDVKMREQPALKPIWKENNSFPIPDYFETGGHTQYIVYQAVSGPQPLIVHGPYMKIHDLPVGSTVELEMGSAKERYPEGFNSHLLRTSSRGNALLKKNPSWNDFPEDIILKNGDNLKIKKQDSIFRLQEINGKKVLSFRNQSYFDTATDDQRTYSTFTGVDENEQVTVALNAEGSKIEHNEKIKLSDNKSFVLSGSPAVLKFVRNGDLLIELDRQVCDRALVRLD